MGVDVFLIPFKGHSVLKQYRKNKLHKWGIKVFASAGASGMLCDFEIYVFKGTKTDKIDLGIISDVVLQLAESILPNKNFKLYIDNQISSCNLAIQLQEKGLLVAGTDSTDRVPSCPIEKAKNDLRAYGRVCFDFKTDEKNIKIVKWFHNKIVTVISTFCGINLVTYVKRMSEL